MNTNEVFQIIWERKLRFIAVFFVIFTLTYTLLYFIDFLPEPPSGDEETPVSLDGQAATSVTRTNSAESFQTVTTQELGIVDLRDETEPVSGSEIVNEPVNVGSSVLPTAIYIEKLDKTVPVLNPTSRTIADLDEALLEGAVRHPDSATMNQEGNVFILGHSSYLPNVVNRNFQAFNGIQELQWGDTIELTAGDKTYIYRVEKVYKAKASEVTVPIANTGNMLTIATCNSFGSTDDRYIVEATQQVVRSS